MNIKRSAELLQNIAAGLNKIDPPGAMPPRRIPIHAVEVTFHVGSERYTFGLAQALDTLASDLFWDERGDWSAAERATVEVI